jgi:DNA end-binding protein Ku
VARSTWKGAIQFGLVTIPVKLYTATESDYTIRFNMLHEPDLSRIQMKVWCPEDEKVISRSETVKGYEYAPDQYVVITDEDLEKVPLKTIRSIEIEQFTPRDETNNSHAQFTKQAYYIEPDKIGRKAFYLLRSVLQEKGLTAICKVVIRDREALAAMDPFEDTMVLTTLHWPDEIRSTKDLDLSDETYEFKPAELKMAEQLVETMTEAFDPSKYKDEYREALLKVIEAKVEGVEIATPEPVEESANLVDLMKLLEASVKAATDSKTAGATEPVNVADAKEARAKRPAAKKATAKPAATHADEADDAESARPARRRKSA